MITDPFYADIDNNTTLDEYWEIFRQDAIRSGKVDPGLDRSTLYSMELNPTLPRGIEHAGRAYTICDETTFALKSFNRFGKISPLFNACTRFITKQDTHATNTAIPVSQMRYVM